MSLACELNSRSFLTRSVVVYFSVPCLRPTRMAITWYHVAYQRPVVTSGAFPVAASAPQTDGPISGEGQSNVCVMVHSWHLAFGSLTCPPSVCSSVALRVSP